MSGHSKWSTIKHKKGRVDAQRGKLFSKLSRLITVAARDGGGDPAMNANLATAIEKAKQYNMPADNIDRAVKKGTGEIEGAQYEAISYEGYGPDGVAVLVEVMTDNRNRAAAEMRHVFTRHNGKLGSSGSVAWMFDRRGIVLLPKSSGDEDTILDAALSAGAEDMAVEEDFYEIRTDPTELADVRRALSEQGLSVESAELTMVPRTTQALSADEAKRVLRFINALEDLDDVQEVFSNFDISAEIMEEVAAEV